MPKLATLSRVPTAAAASLSLVPAAYSTALAHVSDPPFWPTDARAMTCLEKVAMLAAIAPEKVDALHILVDATLREQWWQTARSQDGLARLLHLTADHLTALDARRANGER